MLDRDRLGRICLSSLNFLQEAVVQRGRYLAELSSSRSDYEPTACPGSRLWAMVAQLALSGLRNLILVIVESAILVFVSDCLPQSSIFF